MVFVAVGVATKTSTDGIAWTTRTMPSSSLYRAVAFSTSLNRFLAVGNVGAISSDGITWTAVTLPGNVDASNYYMAATWVEQLGLFVALGLNGRLGTSPDGITWTQRTNTFSRTWENLAYSQDLGLLVAASPTGIATSPDGITWTLRDTRGAAHRDITWCPGPGLFVSVGADNWANDSGKPVATSPDGITWTLRSVVGDFVDVAFSPPLGIAVAVGNGDLATSSNGTSWTARSSIGNIVDVAWGQGNLAPNAPTLTAPASGATFDRNSVQRFALTPSDPDAGDSTSKTDWRYRTIGAPSWTTVTQALPQTYIDFAGGTFAAGDYEWQARTYDAQGVFGPYSASSFFTAATAPETPTITAPINGATVSNKTTATWSTPDQDAYQVRRVADNAGTPNAGTIYYDSGEIVSTTIRSHDLTLTTNNRYEHIQVRQKRDGLWSQWASVRVLVSFTPPTTPVVTLTPDAATGSLLVGITNPAPGAGVPATSYNDVYVDDGDGEERKVAMLAPNTAWRYWTPKSGREYDGSVRVTAVGSNGTTSSSTP